jgi:hypothetical protein
MVFHKRGNHIDLFITSAENTIHQSESELLIREYEVLSDRIEDIVSIYWQAGSIFIGTSITGLAILGQLILNGEKNISSIVIFIIAIACIAILSRWNDAANRWNSNIGKFYIRIKEIEKKLGLFGNTYIDAVDNPNDYSYEDRIHFSNKILAYMEPRNKGETPIKEFRDDIVTIISFAWILLLYLTTILESNEANIQVLYQLQKLFESLINLSTLELFLLILGTGFFGWITYKEAKRSDYFSLYFYTSVSSVIILQLLISFAFFYASITDPLNPHAQIFRIKSIFMLVATILTAIVIYLRGRLLQKRR